MTYLLETDEVEEDTTWKHVSNVVTLEKCNILHPEVQNRSLLFQDSCNFYFNSEN